MATERLSMRKTREILRQKWELGRTHREVAASVGLSLGAVVSRLALTDRARFGETDRDLGVIGVGELSMSGVAGLVRPN
jgi:hypothetical protein